MSFLWCRSVSVHRAFKGLLSAWLVVVGGVASIAGVPAHSHEHKQLPDFDHRRAAAAAKNGVPNASRAQAETKLRERLPRVEVIRDEISRSPKWIGTAGTFLTGRNGVGRSLGTDSLRAFDAADPHRVVKAFVNEHRGVFGHDAAALAAALIKRNHLTPKNGLRSITWEQQLDGVPVFGARFKAHITRHEELVSISSGFLPSLETVADAKQRKIVSEKSSPPISARQALLIAGTNLQSVIDAGQLQQLAAASGAEQRQRLTATGWRHPSELSLVWLPLGESSVRLCWEITLSEPRHHIGYQFFIDADTGEIWKRRCLTDDASPATYRVFTTENPTPLWPGYSTPSSVQPPAVSRSLLTLTSVDVTASPAGWITDGGNTLSGNNASAVYWDPLGDGGSSTHQVSGSPSRVFDFPLSITSNPTNYPHAATVNAFYWVNWMHDKMYELGFTETAANCQDDNFGRGGTGNDGVDVWVQDGTSEDNAGATTNPEGQSPRLQFGIFTGPSPDRDSAFDATIVLHEYGHIVNRRMHDLELGNAQSRGMNEGWSDFWALCFVSNSADSPNACYPQGAYASLNLWGTAYDENFYFGFRRYPYSTDLTKNPLTFKDIDPAQQSLHPGVPTHPVLFAYPGSEVHMQGEVWCSMLWEARARLISKHGYSVGNQMMLELVIEGQRLDPPDPNFIMGRNAILLADAVNNSSANISELWAAFAKRGLGFDATAPTGDTTAGVEESFDTPDDLVVSPGTGLTMKGPVGGPFLPSTRTFTLMNDGNSSFQWRGRADPPLQLSSAAGTLLAGGSINVTAQLNASAAASLPEGVYTPRVYFTNATTGAVFERPFTLLVSLRIPLTEEFSSSGSGSNDLAFTQLLFEPDETGTNYTVCRNANVSTFPTEPSPAFLLDLSATNFVVKTLTGGAQFPFYGQNYSSMAVMDDGSVVFGGQHTNEAVTFNSLNGHFAAPRVSGVRPYYGYWNVDGARITWRQLNDRVAITWENVHHSLTTNTFQIELFFNGQIGITLLRIGKKDGTVGLSPGGGVPLVFVETDLSAAASCVPGPALDLKLPLSASENSGSVTGRVSLPSAVAFNVTVLLGSSDTSEIVVPSTVLIPAGQGFANVPLTVQNDALLDGSRIAYITATAGGYKSATKPIWVHDTETATLAISSGGTVTEGAGGVNRTVSISSSPSEIIAVQLSSSPVNEVYTVPPVALIAPGQTSAVVTVRATDDNRIDGTVLATLTASVTNWTWGSQNFNVQDNESTNLAMFSQFFVNESMGTITNGSRIQIGGTLATNLLVGTFSDDESEVRTPIFGVIIPAGETNVSFPLFIQDDAIVDGAVLTRLRAVANGFGPATNFVFVGDNDGAPEPFNPYPPDFSTNISVDADLSWGRTEGELIVNGTFNTGDLSGWQSEHDEGALWVVNNGTYDPRSPDGPLPPLAGSFSALAEQVGSGTHVLYQDIFIPANATGVGLSWSDQIRNHAGQFFSEQRFAVELRDLTNNVLATIFNTTSNSPAFSPWTNRLFNLNAYRGETVRLAFVVQSRLGYLNVHLDNVSLVATSATVTVFDVYFSTNSTLSEADRISTTALFSRTLPLLAGGTDYFWQIKARRGTTTNVGPVWTFRTEGSSLAGSVIPIGSSWRYRNTGQNLGTTWTNLNYNDAAWGSGVGTLGFGGGQDTTIGFATNEYVTYYFRRKFNILDPSRVAVLTARLQRDDGAVIWINGRMAVAENMPGRGPWAYNDSADTDITGFGEVIPQNFDLSPSLLVPGTNIVAVEMHQYVPNVGYSDDLLFDLELRTITNTGNEAPSVTITAPADFASLLPTNVILTAAVEDEVTIGTVVEFFADNVRLGATTFAPYSFTWTNPPLGAHALYAIATDSLGLSATSASIHVTIASTNGALLSMIPAGAVWRYDSSGIYPDADWRNTSYRDSGWPHGYAQLGYGDGDETTVIPLLNGQFSRPITTYLRHTFDAAAAFNTLQLRVLRDDGVVLYLNGTEIFRNNMPGGIITNNTLASSTIVGAAENTWLTTNLPVHILGPLLRTASRNVLAAEIHQSSANNTDMSFDLQFTGVGNLLPEIAITSPGSGETFLMPSNLVIAAAASDSFGAVTGVEFFRNGVSLGSDPGSPYQFTWTNPPSGLQSLTAVAVDSNNGRATSAPVSIFIYGPVLLSIARDESQVELRWPSSATGYVLETTTNLAPPAAWNQMTNPLVLSNGQFRLRLNSIEREQFFRLRAP